MRDKLSLVFSARSSSARFVTGAGTFCAARYPNLMKIESRPVHGRPWQYRFYLDLQASRPRSGSLCAALGELAKLAVELRILGNYVAAKQVNGAQTLTA